MTILSIPRKCLQLMPRCHTLTSLSYRHQPSQAHVTARLGSPDTPGLLQSQADKTLTRKDRWVHFHDSGTQRLVWRLIRAILITITFPWLRYTAPSFVTYYTHGVAHPSRPHNLRRHHISMTRVHSAQCCYTWWSQCDRSWKGSCQARLNYLHSHCHDHSATRKECSACCHTGTGSWHSDEELKGGGNILLLLLIQAKWCIYVSAKYGTIGADNGLSLVWCQAITWTNSDILSIRPLRTNFSEIWIKIQNFSFMKTHLKMSSAKWQPFCLSLNVNYKVIWGKYIAQGNAGQHQHIQALTIKRKTHICSGCLKNVHFKHSILFYKDYCNLV